jgi:hypothetical protein
MGARREADEHQGRKDGVFLAKFTPDGRSISRVTNVGVGVRERIGTGKDIREFIAREAIADAHLFKSAGELAFVTIRGGDKHVRGQQRGCADRLFRVDLGSIG